MVLDLAIQDPIFFAVMWIAVGVFSAAFGALLGALPLKLATRLLAGFWPGYWKSYGAVFFAAAVTLSLYYGIAKAGVYLDMRVFIPIISGLLGFYIQFLFVRRMIHRSTRQYVGWIEVAGITLIQAAFSFIVLWGIRELEKILTGGGHRSLLQIFQRIFALNDDSWVNQAVLVITSAAILLLAHLLLLIRRRAEPTWLMAEITAISLLPCGFGFMVICRRIMAGIGNTASTSETDYWRLIKSMSSPGRQAALFMGCATILILVSGWLSLHLRRHRLLTSLQQGPKIPAFLWVLSLPLLAIAGLSFLHFLLERMFIAGMAGSGSGIGATAMSMAQILILMYILGLFIIAAGAALTIVAHWRAGKGTGKAPWTLYAMAFVLLLLAGADVMLSIYGYKLFKLG